jgi:chorismate mutase / prephenate dehydratase
MDLERLRKQIDQIDQEIIIRLNDRVKLASKIGKLKDKSGSGIYVPSREEEIFQNLNAVNKGPLDEDAIRTIYREIISAAIALEKKLNIAYLGPKATYTHQAALKSFGRSVCYIPLLTISDVFSAVERNEADYGVIPVENSTEGVVSHSLDLLAETKLKIVSQIHLQISHCLLSNSPLKEIKKVFSKDNALGQCRQWLSRILPGVEKIEKESTASAVQFIKNNPETAAIASKITAEIYNVPIVAENIQDKTDNVTRFLIIGTKSNALLESSGGKAKSSFVFSLNDESGALMLALNPFRERGINLTKIESRPSRKRAWDYYFFIDVAGHYKDQAIKEALDELKKNCPMVKWLGSYPDT